MTKWGNSSGSIYLALQQDGIHIQGDVTVDGEVTANGIPLSTHKHGGVQPGGGQSGAPIG